MLGYNVIALFNRAGDKVLMCKRRKAPYKGLSNFVGGKVKPGEDGLDAAYRELEEETSVTRDDVTLHPVVDYTYHVSGFYLQVYAGRLNKDVPVRGDENELYWSGLDRDFFDTAAFAGDGNIGHIMLLIEYYKQSLLGL